MQSHFTPYRFQLNNIESNHALVGHATTCSLQTYESNYIWSKVSFTWILSLSPVVSSPLAPLENLTIR